VNLRDQLDQLPAWMADAACVTTGTATWWFSAGDEADRAKRICGSCPVRGHCLTHALTNNEQHGIWGGLDEEERDDLRRRYGRRRHG
jgi:WhiB family redox-sensing transcriptional regulator